MLKIIKTATGATFKVRVQPGASKNEIVGVQQGALKVRISAPPVQGKANKALVNFLAKELGVKKSEIEIVSGHTSRVKTIKVIGEGTTGLKKMMDRLGC
ncbi:hypothetical protein LCGC14_2738640 [marine sediment metagenome]|uniref:Uncharacterized protein n=1 Tax=marine sediment metagenome TaxID=412755 RepID=A0A0F9BWU4_9ZZZZ